MSKPIALYRRRFDPKFSSWCPTIGKDGINKALDYKDLEVDLREENFLEEEKIADATFIEKTYLFTNKDGSADKRYKENPVLNLVEYES